MSDEPIKSPLQIKPRLNPLVASLPDHLKDPANFDKIMKFILESLATKHSHGEVVEWASCVSCQKKFHGRGDLLKKLGFRNSAQFMAWRLIHTEIKRRVPLR